MKNQAALLSFVVIGLLATCSEVAHAQQIGKWRRHEISLVNNTYTGNPFELQVDAVFTHADSGATLSLPGYYDGDNTWKFGFMPTELGNWTYVTSSSDPDLNGQSGQVGCVASGLPGLLAADSNNPRKWKLSDAGPVIPIGLRNEFFSRPGDTAVFEQAADFQQENNLLMMETRLTEEYGYWESGRHDYIFEGDWHNHIFDLDVWDRMEERMEALAARGLGAHIMLYSDDAGMPGWSGQSTTEALVLRYAAARLSGYPVVMFNTGIDVSEYRSQADVDWLGAQLRSLDPYNHPISTRDNGSIVTMAGETFSSRGDTFAQIADMTNYFNNSTVPVSMDDAWGENRPSHPYKSFAPADIRRAFWKCVMAGGTGGLIRGSEGLFRFDNVQLDLESEQWLKLINPFLQNRLGNTFGEMVSTPTMVSNGYALADPQRSKVLYYMMGPNDKWDAGNSDPVTVNLAGLPGIYQGVWFDTRTGTETSIGTLRGGGRHQFNLPSADDWVLRLEKTADTWGLPTTIISGWEFNTQGDQEGWVSNAGVTNLGVANGKWNLGMSGVDPYLTGPVLVDPSENAFIVEIVMSSTDSETLGQVFWQGTGDTAFSEARSLKFTVLNDGQMHSYWFDLTREFNEGGAIRQFRLDPVANGNGGVVNIDYIRILAPEIPGDANLDGVVDDKDASVLAMNWFKQTGATWFEGDFNHDGKVDEKDATMLAANWQFGMSASTSVPEPGMFALFAGILLLSARGFKR